MQRKAEKAQREGAERPPSRTRATLFSHDVGTPCTVQRSPYDVMCSKGSVVRVGVGNSQGKRGRAGGGRKVDLFLIVLRSAWGQGGKATN